MTIQHPHDTISRYTPFDSAIMGRISRTGIGYFPAREVVQRKRRGKQRKYRGEFVGIPPRKVSPAAIGESLFAFHAVALVCIGAIIQAKYAVPVEAVYAIAATFTAAYLLGWVLWKYQPWTVRRKEE